MVVSVAGVVATRKLNPKEAVIVKSAMIAMYILNTLPRTRIFITHERSIALDVLYDEVSDCARDLAARH